MADDSELEKRAVEELLRETDRARVRAETMGPTGWMKCPLGSTNKRFLLNTLRPTGLQRRSGEPAAGESSTRGRQRSRSRTPPRERRANGGHTEHRHHHKDRNKGQDRDKDRRDRYKDASRNKRDREDDHNGDRDRDRRQKDVCPSEGHSSSRDQS
ncbi:uncharacterized protein LOC143016796 [Genypterus blacodes]|uniref:uncharacterized protein LOC143016796 n=1 Tax=Genypterus blacodes TaxID=154954 RepID=UPI003F76C221